MDAWDEVALLSQYQSFTTFWRVPGMEQPAPRMGEAAVAATVGGCHRERARMAQRQHRIRREDEPEGHRASRCGLYNVLIQRNDCFSELGNLGPIQCTALLKAVMGPHQQQGNQRINS